MKNSLFIIALLFILAISGCSIPDRYSQIPKLTIMIDSVKPRSVILTGILTGTQNAMTGFIVTRHSNLSIYDPDAIIVVCLPDRGKFSAIIPLDHNITYLGTSFAFMETGEVNLIYGNVVHFKTK